MLRAAAKRAIALLSTEERTVGVSFADNALYCALRPLVAEDPILTIRHPLPSGVIAGGIVTDPDLLAIHLKEALAALHTSAPFCVIVIPSSLVFSSILHVPPAPGAPEREAAAIDLLLDIELPWKREAAYTDRIITRSSNNVRASIFSILRTSADPYILAAQKAGLEVIALEHDAMSIQRIMTPSDDYAITLNATETHASIVVTHGGRIEFLFTLPADRVRQREDVDREIAHIRAYFESETGERLAPTLVMLTLRDEVKTLLGTRAEDMRFFPSVGGALRETIPRDAGGGEISLLPLTSDELHGFHRFATGLRILRQSTIAVCLVLIAVHFFLYQILVTIAEQNAERTSRAPHLATDLTEITKQTNSLNDALTTGDAIGALVRRYSDALATVDKTLTDGVAYDSIDITDPASMITITGNAGTRAQYNFFRTAIGGSSDVSVVSFPLGDLNTVANIPFNISIKIVPH